MKSGKIAVAAISVVALSIIALYCNESRFNGQPDESASHRHYDKAAAEHPVNPILDAPARFTVDGARKADIQALFDMISVAYSNCDYGVIAIYEDALPQIAECLHDSDFAQVTGGFYGMLSGELSGKRVPLRRFDDLNEFYSRAKTDIAAMKLYGKACLRRKSGGDVSCRLEALALKRLSSYREMFAAEDRTEFVRMADRFISEWIDHIESPDGFSRAEALYWLEYSRQWGYDAYGKKEQWPVLRNKAIRQGSKWLDRVGYTPKWIEELEKTTDK